MSKFSLRWAENSPESRTLELCVDGLSFLEHVRRWELEQCPEPALAGDYAAYTALFRMMLERCSPGQISEIAILNCPCGDSFCWPLEAQMETTDRHVIWSRFVQPHRRDTWTYEGFGPFIFERVEFTEAIDDILDA
ncbi:hypothetical protein MF271_11425 [Deinococcus sp. KNUC1210]|uniref:hypothetical protein n=1 Tax=Deinococcus sp. KNUC1210 TaxID=2917691 RepID=UPI001EEFC415|nr:hypothetical protein [Deinococcus sp. KNUC1210]ULH14621.1 hypothetical protein MF271_11425 [Deinococcus sp. KNUC1210]